MTIIELAWHQTPTIACDYIADIVSSGAGKRSSDPCVKDENLAVIGRDPTFVVLSVKHVDRGFSGGRIGGKKGVQHSAKVYCLVLMDNTVVFPARLESSLTPMAGEIEIGSTITVTKKFFLWMEEFCPLKPRGVMIVQEFEHHHGPADHSCHNMETEPEIEWFQSNIVAEQSIFKTRFDTKVIERVDHLKEFCVVSYSPPEELGERWVWTSASIRHLRSGLWILGEDSRRDWVTQLRVLKGNESPPHVLDDWPDDMCNCVRRYKHKKCILETFPLLTCDRTLLYQELKPHLGGRAPDKWEKLSLELKRWSLFWYYSVNRFVTLDKGTENLPMCLVNYIRTAYADPPGVCFGGSLVKV
jgi:hypothetical protein